MNKHPKLLATDVMDLEVTLFVIESPKRASLLPNNVSNDTAAKILKPNK